MAVGTSFIFYRVNEGNGVTAGIHTTRMFSHTDIAGDVNFFFFFLSSSVFCYKIVTDVAYSVMERTDKQSV